jgi:hypothetical protein
MAQPFQDVVQQRIDLTRVAFQDVRPPQFGKAVGEPLRSRRVAQLDKGVVDLFESNAPLLELPRHVLVAIGVHLASERRPSLQADVHDSQVAVVEVVIQNTLRHFPQHEARAVLSGSQFEGRASFHDAQNTNQPLAHRMPIALLFSPGVLVDLAGFILPSSAALPCELLGVLDQAFGPFRAKKSQEIGTPHLQNVINELLKLGRPTDWQMALKNYAVKTGENPRNEPGKLGNKRRYCLHGIRFLNDCLVTIILESRMPFFISYGRWAEPTLRQESPLLMSAFRRNF